MFPSGFVRRARNSRTLALPTGLPLDQSRYREPIASYPRATTRCGDSSTRKSTSGHPCGVIPRLGRRRMLSGMNGWLLWGLILPVLLVVAGIVQFQRNKRR